MNEVLKVSIARVSFTLEKEACRTLEQYLDKLKVYYKAEIGKDEILDDIEERIAELIIERGGKERVVTGEDIRSIVDVLGKPYESEPAFGAGENSFQEKPKRTLFRDSDNRVIAGVCSGLAAYFKMDAVWIRIIFLLFFILPSAVPLFALRRIFNFNLSWFGLMLLTYIVLWMIIPAAKTVTQKCAMHGKSGSIDEIQRKFSEGARSAGRDFGRKIEGVVFSALGRVFLMVMGVIFTIIGLLGIVGGWILLLGVDVVSGVNVFDLPDYIQLNTSGLWLKITGILTYFLPFIGVLYAGIHLSFGLKSPKWKPGLLIFVLWIISLLAFLSFAAISFKPYYSHYETIQAIPIQKQYDTLYVRYPRTENCTDLSMYIDAERNKLSLFYGNTLADKEKEFVFYPNLRIYRQSSKSMIRLECEVDYFNDLALFDGGNMPNLGNIVSVTDSVITVKPEIFSKRSKFRGNLASLKLFVPERTVVILQEPIEHVFSKNSQRLRGVFVRRRPFCLFD